MPGMGLPQWQASLASGHAEIHCRVGVGVGSACVLPADAPHEVDIFEGDPVVAAHHAVAPLDGGLRLVTGRYHGVSTSWALSAVNDPAAFALMLADSLQPGGRLMLHELWCETEAAGRRLGGTLGLWRDDLVLPARQKVLASLSGCLVLREARECAGALKDDIRDALVRGQGVLHRMQDLPDEARRHCMPALARELQRALVLFDAIDRGLLTASLHVFERPAVA